MTFPGRAIVVAMLLAVSVAVAGLAAALFTAPGNRLLLQAAEHFLPLEIEYGGGSLAHELLIAQLRFDTDSLNVELLDVSLSIEPRCLQRRVVCVRTMHARSLAIDIPQDERQVPAETLPAGEAGVAHLVSFPLPIEVDSLAVDTTRISWQGGEWRQGQARLALRVRDHTVDIIDATFTEPSLELRGSSSTPAAADPRLPRIELPVGLAVGEVVLIRPSMVMEGASHQLQSLSLSGSWLRSKLRVSQLSADGGAAGALSLSGDLEFEDNWPLQAVLTARVQQTAAWPWRGEREISVAIDGDFSDAALQFTTTGMPALAGQASINLLEPALPFTAAVSATGLEGLEIAELGNLPDVFTDTRLLSPLTLSVAGTLSSQQASLQVSGSSLGYESLEASLALRHESGRLTIDNMTLLDRDTGSRLEGSGELALSAGISWSLAFGSPGMRLPPLGDHVVGKLAGRLRTAGELRDNDWRVEVRDVDLQGVVNNLPARIRGTASVRDGAVAAGSDLHALVNGATLRLIAAKNGAGTAQLELTVDDLGRWLAESRGSLRLSAAYAPDSRHYMLAGDLDGLEWGGMRIGGGTVKGGYWTGSDPSLQLESTFTDIALGAVDLDSLRVTGRTSESTQMVSVDSLGDIRGELSVTGQWRGETWQGQLAPARLHTAHGAWQLGEAVALNWSRPLQQLEVSSHCWRLQDSRLCPGTWRLGREGRGSLQAVVDLALFAGLLPVGVEANGDAEASLEAGWRPGGGLVAEGRLQARALEIKRDFGKRESAYTRFDGVGVDFKYTPGGLDLSGILELDNQQVAALNILLPPDRTDSMQGSMRFEQLQLESFATFFPGFSQLAGEVSGALSLYGSARRPLARGSLRLTEGRLAIVGNPTVLEDLQLSVDFSGDRARLRGRSLLGGGELALSGELAASPDLQLRLSLEGRNHAVLFPPSTSVVLSESLQIKARRDIVEISGDITVHEGTLLFEQLPEGGVALSPDVVEVDYAGNVITEELPVDLVMDVQLRVKDGFMLTGSELQTALAGDLSLRQRAGEPLQVFGSLETVGGELRAHGQRLRIRRGTFGFSGKPGNPTLDIKAERQISGADVSVGIRVQGPLEEELQLEIYSDPAMSQGDAISYLMRDRPLDRGAGGDGTAMALSLAGGVVNRTALVTWLNRVPGISDVSFGTQGSEQDTAATISGYVGNRIYLSYGIGVYEPINVLTARVYLSTRLLLEVVSRLDNSVDLYYSFDIE